MKVILILVDGMRPDALELTKNKCLFRMKENSSYCFHATSIVPSVTLPCHTSLFMSVDPDRHGITTNTWMPQVRPIDSIMDAAKKDGLKTAMFYNWEYLRDLNRPGSLDHSDFDVLSLDYHTNPGNVERDKESERLMTDRVIEYCSKEAPDLTFVYYGLTDEIGHYFSWMSDKYIDAVSNAEECIERLRNSLGEEYQIIVTADHGGHEMVHGTEEKEDMTIPMIFNGTAFEAGKAFNEVNLKDIAPTIAKILGIRKPKEWIGKELI